MLTLYFSGGQQRRRNRTAERETRGANKRDRVSVVRRRRGRRDGTDPRGLALRALQAEYTQTRLEETIRCRVLEEDHILQLGE